MIIYTIILYYIIIDIKYRYIHIICTYIYIYRVTCTTRGLTYEGWELTHETVLSFMTEVAPGGSDTLLAPRESRCQGVAHREPGL